jgi:predicted Zn-dependent protease
MGKNPAALADLLERLERKVCGPKECSPNWLGSHPATALRAQRLRKF